MLKLIAFEACEVEVSFNQPPTPLTLTTSLTTASFNTPRLASTTVSHSRARVMPVYTSSRVRIGLSVGGSSSAVCKNSEPWDLCTDIANTVSTACRREGSTQRIGLSVSLVGKATLNSFCCGLRGSGTARVMPISPFISFRP